ncbi:hypothetical protein GWI33_002858 [Rhynchophorus ferrugineus]|uniref:Uncharacterized protein n=1 Tax=Rhynchophorus ferrugineus TaxID=354439 RepID=A0A834MK79_RHYFE|nr:hypothetical protein GWI33_002858 [Rhynchophorus ferrugineus]
MGYNGIYTGNIVSFDYSDINDVIVPIITKPIWDNLSELSKVQYRIRFLIYTQATVIRKNCTLKQFLIDIVPPVAFSRSIDSNFDGNISLHIHEYNKYHVSTEDIVLASNFDLSEINFDEIESYASYNLSNFIICVSSAEYHDSSTEEILTDTFVVFLEVFNG